jgi:phytanoyl-CoA dioxygenase PhyH
MKVVMGKQILTFPDGELGELRDANSLLGDPAALQQRMQEDGYLLLRQLIDRDAVLQARHVILEHMAEQDALVPGKPVLEGVMPANGKSVPMLGRKGITHHDAVRRVFEGNELFGFFESFFEEQAQTFDYKWLRGVGNEGFTGAHYDVVYMGRGSDRLHTCWIPFGDLDIEQGTLAMCVGSHNQPGFEKLRNTYGQMDVDRDLIEGWFTEDPLEITEKFGGQWKTTNYRAGDVIIFGMYTMHGSTTNTTDRFRLSADVRFQPNADPVDERWAGENSIGHYAWHGADQLVSMVEARAAWGV